MWMKEVFLGFIGLASGTAVSAGVFSFIITVGVVPRIIGKSRTANDIILYENAVVLGGVLGNIFSLFHIPLHLGIGLVILFGLFLSGVLRWRLQKFSTRFRSCFGGWESRKG